MRTFLRVFPTKTWRSDASSSSAAIAGVKTLSILITFPETDPVLPIPVLTTEAPCRS